MEVNFTLFIAILVFCATLQYASGNTKDIFGTEDEPADITCRAAPPHISSGIYFMGPSSQVFEVFCNMTTKETCLDTEGQKTSYLYYTGESTILPSPYVVEGPFWLSNLGIHLNEMYNVTRDQIEWLQKRSSSARQILRYRCFNSSPYSEKNTSLSVQLLTWNNVAIGSRPTDSSPVHYTVPLDTHDCLGSTTVRTTDIVIQTSNVYNLPIIDMQIRDIRNEIQAMYIQNIQLCFK